MSEKENVVGEVAGYETPRSFFKIIHCEHWVGPSRVPALALFLTSRVILDELTSLTTDYSSV